MYIYWCKLIHFPTHTELLSSGHLLYRYYHIVHLQYMVLLYMSRMEDSMLCMHNGIILLCTHDGILCMHVGKLCIHDDILDP